MAPISPTSIGASLLAWADETRRNRVEGKEKSAQALLFHNGDPNVASMRSLMAFALAVAFVSASLAGETWQDAFERAMGQISSETFSNRRSEGRSQRSRLLAESTEIVDGEAVGTPSICQIWIWGDEDYLISRWILERNRAKRMLILALFVTRDVEIVRDPYRRYRKELFDSLPLMNPEQQGERREEMELARKRAPALAVQFLKAFGGHLGQLAQAELEYTASFERGGAREGKYDQRYGAEAIQELVVDSPVAFQVFEKDSIPSAHGARLIPLSSLHRRLIPDWEAARARMDAKVPETEDGNRSIVGLDTIAVVINDPAISGPKRVYMVHHGARTVGVYDQCIWDARKRILKSGLLSGYAEEAAGGKLVAGVVRGFIPRWMEVQRFEETGGSKEGAAK
jgi:hypothetical protein